MYILNDNGSFKYVNANITFSDYQRMFFESFGIIFDTFNSGDGVEEEKALSSNIPCHAFSEGGDIKPCVHGPNQSMGQRNSHWPFERYPEREKAHTFSPHFFLNH